jgi:iron complex outermembrane receptor protein
MPFRFWLGLICCLLTTFGIAPNAQAQTRSSFDLPVQSLATSLRAVASLTGTNVLFDPPLVEGRVAPALKAQLTLDQAFAKLLTGTGLTYKHLDDKTVTIVSASTGSAGQSTTQNASAGSANDASTNKEVGKKSSSQDFRVAQVDQNAAGPQVEKDQKLERKKKEEGLTEIVVTGSRIPTVAGQQTVPVRSYTREEIANSGQSTVGDFLNTLPDVSTQINGNLQFGFPGTQTVQLHGLPVGTTLTMLNGRRLETSSSGFFDLSNIPVSAVDRIEILPVGASAIYGADALGGAVNFILRKDFSGFEANATLDHARDVNDPGANLSWGKSWDRGSVAIIASYQKYGHLLGTQREPVSLTGFPDGFPVAAFFSDTCAPGNVYSFDGVSNLPGLSSPHASIPAGITGIPTTAQFVPTAGKFNICNFNRYVDITPESQREGALLTGHYQVGDSADIFAEVLLSHRTLQNQFGPQLQVFSFGGGTVSANNPYNPFGQDVNVSFVYPGTGAQYVQSTSLVHPTIGVRGSVLSDWHYEASATFSNDRLHDVVALSDFTAVANALQSSDPATALNPFASGAPGGAQLLSSLKGAPSDRVLDDRIANGQFILRGTILQLPAGPLQTVIGGEYSQEKQITISTGNPSLFLQRHSFAAFSEARIPLLAGSELAQGGERLTLTLAGRFDHSNDYGGKTTWQGGVLWRTSETLSVTGSYGQSYRAPQLQEISGPQNAFSGGNLGVVDPSRGGETELYPITVVSGPNPKLAPETGSSSTLGITYSREARHGLSASLTWYDLKISNYIGLEASQVVIDNPNLFPGAIIRAPATPQDQQQGFLGLITQFNDVYYNFGDLRVTGVDADLRYEFNTPFGQFTPSVAIANIYRWQSALRPSLPAIDAVSRATLTGVGWAPRWKRTLALAWNRGPVSMNVSGRYIARYLDYQDFLPNSNELGNSWIVDLGARYDMGHALRASSPWLKSAFVALGVVNLLDKKPPFSNTLYWYDPKEYDVRGRFLHLSVGLRL